MGAFSSIEITSMDYWVVVLFWGAVFFLLIRFFYSPKRYKRMLKGEYSLSLSGKIAWNLSAVGYMAGSILALPLVFR